MLEITKYQIGTAVAALCVGPILLVFGASITLESMHCKNTWNASPAKVIYAGRADEYIFRYAYVVDGEKYTSPSVDQGMWSQFFGSNTRRAVHTFPTGSDITIYYDPEFPHRAVLWNEVPREGPVELALGSLLFFGAIICLHRLK